MIKFLQKLFLIIFILFSFFSINYSYGDFSQKHKYISLTPQSSKSDIIKFQKFFKALKIYKSKIDGKYSSIKNDIINFQIKNKIIKSKNSNGAGYIGPKTFSYFDKKYGNDFYKAYLKFFPKTQEDKIENQKCFIVSAYYSPLANQKKYSTGTYSGDIKLNGNGTHGASGNPVHPGFIAAPKAYPFGTKIEIEGLGIGVVEDRGGAIVRKGVRGHKCDRLDIWMGYGDDGLNRALKWGKKEVKGKIVNKNSKITINFPTKIRKYLAKKITPKSNKSDLEKMQKLFLKAKLYNGKIDGKYSSFKKAIIDFQLKNKIIKSKQEDGAGYIGPKTIKKLEEIYPKVFIYVRKEDILQNIKNKKEKKIKKENKNGLIPKKKLIKNKIKSNYNLTKKQKKQLNKILNQIKNKSKRKRKKIRKKLIVVMNKINNKKLKNQINYLINKIKVN